MKIDKLILGDYKTNCYVVSHDNVCIIIDPACDGETIDTFLKSKQLKVKTIFLTHGHPDHIGAVDYLYKIYRCPIRAHFYDKELVKASNPSKLMTIPELKDVKVSSPVQFFEGEFNSFSVDGIVVDAILTPGHSEGSVTYVLRDYNRIFSGDTIMKETIGRVDFPTSNGLKMSKSIEIYKNFIDECKIHPGHGESTSVDHEKEYNSYFQYK